MYARVTQLRPKLLGKTAENQSECQGAGAAPLPFAWLYVEGRVFHHIRSGKWRANIPALSTFLEAETMPSLEEKLRQELNERLPYRLEFRYEPGGRVLVSSPDLEGWGKAFLALLGPDTELILRSYGGGREADPPRPNAKIKRNSPVWP